MSRVRPFFCGNWKLFGTREESVALATGVRDGLAGITDADVGVAPGFIALAEVAQVLADSPIATAAQNGSPEPKGAFTGEASMAQIADSGASHVILGHSERRQLFGETDASVARKTKAALEAGLVPVVCVGETLEQRDNGTTLPVVATQVKGAFEGFTADEIAKCVVAYEPVWAIGTGRNATPEQAVEVHQSIRANLRELIGTEADAFRILYGGSVKPNNVAGLLSQPEINGALVGGASLKVESFVELVKEGLAACSPRS